MNTQEILQGVRAYIDTQDARQVYDISKAHASSGVLAKYADLAAALGNNGANVPQDYRHGGMTVRFVQSTDSMYLQYRLTADDWSTDVADWESIDNDVVLQTGSSVTIRPNVLNRWSSPMAALTIAFATPASEKIVNEYMIEFPCPLNAATALTLPAGIKWVNDEEPYFEEGYVYQISIINGLGICAGWKNV